MRISDWSSDVCSSDLRARAKSSTALARCGQYAESRQKSLSARASCRALWGILLFAAALKPDPLINSSRSPPIAIISPGPVTRSEEHTSELQSLMRISYAVFCLKKKKTKKQTPHTTSQQITLNNK